MKKQVPVVIMAMAVWVVLGSQLLADPPLNAADRGATPFIAVSPEAVTSAVPIIICSANAVAPDWEAILARPRPPGSSPQNIIRDAALYLQEAVEKMTGRKLPIRGGADSRKGIVLLLAADLPLDLRSDRLIQNALRNDGSDGYNDREAFFLRSEKDRVLILANTADGLAAGVVELLESVEYEVLGMGPNWIHVPDKRREPLVFQVSHGGRPGFYVRDMGATSGQFLGFGTLALTEEKLADPADELVMPSYLRWRVGWRMSGCSMPGFPGHSLQSYHRAVLAKMHALRQTEGFLTPTRIGPTAGRPPASPENQGQLWINDDPVETNGNDKVFYSNGSEWVLQPLSGVGASLDLTAPFVREIVLDDMKKAAVQQFEAHPDDLFVFATDPEDGSGYATFERQARYKNWYPDYLDREHLPFGKRYVLHKLKGLDAPRETWDPASPGDTVFAFNNWLLQNFDRWVDSLPEKERVTATGKSKKALVRCSFYSYNYHDVPPNFNLDPRIRLMIAGYPKHRGMGKWKDFPSQLDVAKAFQIMLPREPSGDYRIISLSRYYDGSMDSIEPNWNASSAAILKDLGETYRAGVRAMSYEVDFNFGRNGLGYYLLNQTLWNPGMTPAELDAIRNRWLRRAYGSAGPKMKAYYDFMLKENFTINGPGRWAQAVRLLDEASRQIDDAQEPAARTRIDDLKQFWYYYYLVDTEKTKPTDPEMREFVWKGQMSYMTAMHMVMSLWFKSETFHTVYAAAGRELASGPAHYTPAETAVWWKKILDHWPLVPVASFADAVLADGRKGGDIDLNDLVMVSDFEKLRPEPGIFAQGFLYNSGSQVPPTFSCIASQAGEEIGFRLLWKADPTGLDAFYTAKDLPYGVDVWNPSTRVWDPVLDRSVTHQPSQEITIPEGDGQLEHVVTVRLKAPRAGAYRFNIGLGGNLAFLTDLSYDPSSGKQTGPRKGFTFLTKYMGLTQPGVWFYIPKGTRTLDLEVWDSNGGKILVLFKGLPSAPGVTSRRVDIGARGTHRVALEDGEGGTVASIGGNLLFVPYFYSIPPYWAKSPSQLAVPRAIAEADGLDIVK